MPSLQFFQTNRGVLGDPQLDRTARMSGDNVEIRRRHNNRIVQELNSSWQMLIDELVRYVNSPMAGFGVSGQRQSVARYGLARRGLAHGARPQLLRCLFG